MAIEELERVLDALDASVVRAKAIVADPDGRIWSAQVVGQRRTLEVLPEVEHEATTDLVTIAID